jgi:hypothetical protein
MPAASTLQPDRYHRGDTGDFRQVDSADSDQPVYGWSGGVVYRNLAASTAHVNTTTEALFDTQYSIPANTLVAGSVIEVEYQGIITAAANSDTATIKLYIGGLTGTAILTGTATNATTNDIFSGKATIVVRTAGTTGTLVASGHHTDVPAASGTATIGIAEITASTTINTQAAQVIGVGCDWSVADVNSSARLDILVVKIY